MNKNIMAITIIVTIALLLTGCDKEQPSSENDSNVILLPTDATDDLYMDLDVNGCLLGDYTYPEHPAEELRSFLASDAGERELPMEISVVETIEFDGNEYSQIKIDFTDGNENVCIISFFNKSLEYDYDTKFDGRDNPSFSMAFMDAENSQDMVTLLTSVMKYLSPDLSIGEAERLALNQDKTIGAGGYSQPCDIGGYQVQAQYANPYVFSSTSDFDAKLGVKVRALKQIWKGTFDTQNCIELVTAQDFEYLNSRYNSLDEGYPEIVYADFIVKNMWHRQSYLHGETWVVVDLESMTGEEYSITLDTWTFPMAYEFGVGQQYTLYIGLDYITGARGGIMYAVQQTESSDHNSRGEQYPLDYPTEAWYGGHLRRVEPEGKGTVYNVYFVLKSQTWGQAFAALEGHGIGEAQWPGSSPGWEGYTFIGWYDNMDWNGEPYTKDTPIYKDTYLYARWEYIGSGGVWPRAHYGVIRGIDEGSSFAIGQKLTITALGYNMNLESPRDQRFRWIPVAWRLSDGSSGSFSNESPFEVTFTLSGKGEQLLFITYLEETFDGTHWQETGQVLEVEERVFLVTG